MKPRRSAVQLRDLVQTNLEAQERLEPAHNAFEPTGLVVGMPYAHPIDALGRNWDIAEARGVRRVVVLRVVIDSVREAYDLEGGATSAPANGRHGRR